MITAKRLLSALTVLLAVFLFVPDASAQARPYRGGFHRGFELNGYLTYFNFEKSTDLDDDTGVGFRFGYLYNPQQEVEFLIDSISTTGAIRDIITHQIIAIADDNITHFQVAYVFNFTSHDVVPYITAGVGFLSTDDSVLGTETDLTFGLGGGVRFFLGRVLYARVEGRQNFFSGNQPVFLDGESLSFQEVSFGVGWRFPTR